MPDTEEFASWLESRRLIVAQLAAMDSAIRDLGARLDRLNDASRERTTETSKEAQSGISNLNLRVAMLELRTKMWGAFIGLVSGGLASIAVRLVMRALEK